MTDGTTRAVAAVDFATNPIEFFAAGESQQKQSSGLFLAKNANKEHEVQRSGGRESSSNQNEVLMQKSDEALVNPSSVLEGFKPNSVYFLRTSYFFKIKTETKKEKEFNEVFANDNLQKFISNKNYQNLIIFI